MHYKIVDLKHRIDVASYVPQEIREIGPDASEPERIHRLSRDSRSMGLLRQAEAAHEGGPTRIGFKHIESREPDASA